MDREKIIAQRKIWYNQTFVLFEICKCLKNRELAFLKSKEEVTPKRVRYLVSFAVDYLKKHIERFDFLDYLANMYHSVALLTNIPMFSYNLKERQHEEEYIKFNQEFDKHIIGYNLFFDIDGKTDFAKAYEDAKQLKSILEENKVPYYLLNSSNCGFHFQIPQEYLEGFNLMDLIKIDINNVIYNLKGIYMLDSLDDSVVDTKRLCKVPYSYVCDGSICLPLDDYQFKYFSPERVSYDFVSKNIHIKNRGLLTRTYGLSLEQLRSNTKAFIDNYK